ncbi:hypothetical protein M0R45_033952 [Rubus argutus]|uniref:DC1 domain-containing protein n=1 Tax=Rubus argutus TaxID=59490 RepID=A0AAW1VR60_RUBAR
MVKHFSHRHELELCPPLQQDQDDETSLVCSVCEYELDSGEGGSLVYKCSKSCNTKCHFYLHDLCFQLPRQILHKSHPKHPLLLSLPPYRNGEFTCNACGECSTSFAFHCPKCKFDLHVQCATLPQTPTHRHHHQHPLTLLFLSPNIPEKKINCDLCKGSISHWLYYCEDCDYANHIHCSTDEAAAHHHV